MYGFKLKNVTIKVFVLLCGRFSNVALITISNDIILPKLRILFFKHNIFLILKKIDISLLNNLGAKHVFD